MNVGANPALRRWANHSRPVGLTWEAGLKRLCREEVSPLTRLQLFPTATPGLLPSLRGWLRRNGRSLSDSEVCSPVATQPLKASSTQEAAATFSAAVGWLLRTFVRTDRGLRPHATFALQKLPLSFVANVLQGYFVMFHEEHFRKLFFVEHSCGWIG